MLGAARKWLDGALFDPHGPAQWAVFLFIIALITLSVFEVAITSQYPDFAARYGDEIHLARTVIAVIFVCEIVLRIFTRPQPRQYLFTWGALIDVAAVSPLFLGLFLPVGPAEAVWLRALRLVRLARIGPLLARARDIKNPFMDLLARLAPLAAWVLAIKAVFLFAEQEGWWPEIEGLSIIITVIGFAIGILLSTRLTTVHGRLYSFDERLTHLVGSVEAARAYVDDRLLLRWLKVLRGKLRGTHDIHDFRRANDELREGGGEKIPGPIYNAMHQHAQFLIHRALTRTPNLYVSLIKGMIAVYLGVVIIAIPGLTGLLASILVVYALGGMALIVEEMDQPLDSSGQSLINSDVRRFEEYIANTERELEALETEKA